MISSTNPSSEVEEIVKPSPREFHPKNENTPAPPQDHGDVLEQPICDCDEKSSFTQRRSSKPPSRAGDAAPCVNESQEECYPVRRDDEVKLIRKKREREYQQAVLRQIEERKQQRLLRRQQELRQDVVQLSRDTRLSEYQQQLKRERQDQLATQLQIEREKQTNYQEKIENLRQDLVRQGINDGSVAEGTPTPSLSTCRKEREHKSEIESETSQTTLPNISSEEPTNPPAESSKPVGDLFPSDSSLQKEDVVKVTSNVTLDSRKPWTHSQLLQRELARRRHEKAALEAAKEAAMARKSGAWMQTMRSPEQNAIRQRVLTEWCQTKDTQRKEKLAAASAAARSASEVQEERKKRAAESYTQWLSDIHYRRYSSVRPSAVTELMGFRYYDIQRNVLDAMEYYSRKAQLLKTLTTSHQNPKRQI